MYQLIRTYARHKKRVRQSVMTAAGPDSSGGNIIAGITYAYILSPAAELNVLLCKQDDLDIYV